MLTGQDRLAAFKRAHAQAISQVGQYPTPGGAGFSSSTAYHEDLQNTYKDAIGGLDLSQFVDANQLRTNKRMQADMRQAEHIQNGVEKGMVEPKEGHRRIMQLLDRNASTQIPMTDLRRQQMEQGMGLREQAAQAAEERTKVAAEHYKQQQTVGAATAVVDHAKLVHAEAEKHVATLHTEVAAAQKAVDGWTNTFNRYSDAYWKNPKKDKDNNFSLVTDGKEVFLSEGQIFAATAALQVHLTAAKQALESAKAQHEQAISDAKTTRKALDDAYDGLTKVHQGQQGAGALPQGAVSGGIGGGVPVPPAPPNPAERKVDQTYTLPDGRRGIWRGTAWEV
jgi:hypothetical protein